MRVESTVSEIVLGEQDLVDLIRDQEASDEGTTITISKIDFLHAISRFDSMAMLTDEEREELREKYGSDDPSEIVSESMEEEYDRLLHNLSISGEYHIDYIHDVYGEWAEEALREEDTVEWHDGYRTFAWIGDGE
jgi:hypothetical protein